jgi:hypothetical protein
LRIRFLKSGVAQDVRHHSKIRPAPTSCDSPRLRLQDEWAVAGVAWQGRNSFGYPVVVNVESMIHSASRSLQSLAPALETILSEENLTDLIHRSERQGHFAPEADDRLQSWFARYLNTRGGLHETIDDLRPLAMPEAGRIEERDRCRAFLLAYAATCLLVRAARNLVDEVATHSITQRKLNEGSVRHRIPRKQYTQIYRSLTHPRNAWRINEAMHYADTHRAELESLADDPELAPALAWLGDSEDALRIGVKRYLKARLRFRWHSWRRRRASAMQQAMFALFETGGRLVADVKYWGRGHEVDDRVIARLSELLEPGDVLVTRHHHALTNLFLPGFWPHAALHVGLDSDREQLGLLLSDQLKGVWSGSKRVLEAKKDGVLFRDLSETLAVDAVTVIRPTLEKADLAEALHRAVQHEGKLYNFDFDFFTEDRLVCTEVAYRAFDGLGPIKFELQDRLGRLTFSAEDLLSVALDGRGFTPVAIFGAPGCERELVTGSRAGELLANSFTPSIEPD